MKKTLLNIIITAVLVGAAVFYGGMKYGQSKNPALVRLSTFQQQRPNQTGITAANIGGRMSNRGNGFTSGEISSKDDKSIVVKLPDGGSKIIFFSSSTKIMKSTDGSLDDLSIGKNIMVNGSPNQDGSLTAQTIETR